MKTKIIYILSLSLLFSCSTSKSTDEKTVKFKNPHLKSSVYKEVIDSLGSGFTILEKEDSILADSVFVIFNSGFDKDSIQLYYDSVLVYNKRLVTNYVWGLSGETLLPRIKRDTIRLDLIIRQLIL